MSSPPPLDYEFFFDRVSRAFYSHLIWRVPTTTTTTVRTTITRDGGGPVLPYQIWIHSSPLLSFPNHFPKNFLFLFHYIHHKRIPSHFPRQPHPQFVSLSTSDPRPKFYHDSKLSFFILIPDPNPPIPNRSHT